ncbi:MAG TPA: hypothetical protein VK619_10340 [Pyrinomonadaceae bacterium]|nr:hypothetical protein [Pyrinomonadaceae bacterium]
MSFHIPQSAVDRLPGYFPRKRRVPDERELPGPETLEEVVRRVAAVQGPTNNQASIFSPRPPEQQGLQQSTRDLPGYNPPAPTTPELPGYNPQAEATPPTMPSDTTTRPRMAGTHIDTRGMSEVERRAAILAAQTNTPANQKITVTDSSIDIAPPKKMSHLKALALGGLRGFFQNGLVGAITQGAATGIAPSLEQRMEREQSQTEAQGNYAQAASIEHNRIANETAQTENAARVAGIVHNQNEDQRNVARDQETARNSAQQRIISIYNDLEDFDPDATDPRTKALVRAAENAGVPLVKKTKSQKITMQIAPDGTPILTDGQGHVWRAGTDSRTGQPLNVARPREITNAELPYEMFGIPSDEQIRDEARAGVAPSLRNRQVKPEITQRAQYRNQDGTPNMDAIWADIDAGIIHPSDVWENVTERDEQQLAQARSSVRTKYQQAQRDVDEFRLRVGRNHPTVANPTSTPLANLVRRFNEIREMSAGRKRDQALKTFYDTLPFLQIQ